MSANANVPSNRASELQNTTYSVAESHSLTDDTIYGIIPTMMIDKKHNLSNAKNHRLPGQWFLHIWCDDFNLGNRRMTWPDTLRPMSVIHPVSTYMRVAPKSILHPRKIRNPQHGLRRHSSCIRQMVQTLPYRQDRSPKRWWSNPHQS